MPSSLRTWLTRVNHRLRPHHPAADEGLAAGTGLLTGVAARDRAPERRSCPSCEGDGRVEAIDLVRFRVDWRCDVCGRSWTERRVPSRAVAPPRSHRITPPGRHV